MKTKILAMFILISFLSQIYAHTMLAKDFLSEVDNIKMTNKDLENIKRDIITFFDYFHAFEGISKSPPEIEGMPGYFNKINTIERIGKINSESQYEIYRQLRLSWRHKGFSYGFL